MYYPPPQPVYYGSQYSGCFKFFLYALSFFVPLAGLIIGFVYMGRPDPESKRLGQTALILGIVSIVLSCCVGIATPLLILPFLETQGFTY